MGIYTKFAALALLIAAPCATQAQNTPASQQEKLNRGVVAARTGTSNFVSWRLLATDDDLTSFTLLCNGTAVRSNIHDATCYTHSSGPLNAQYQVVKCVNGVPVDTSEVATAWSDIYYRLPLNKPENGTNTKGYEYSYTPNDCSVGDVDGDGEYEIIVKWDPDNSQDNGHSDSGSDEFTGPVLLDCYKLDGTQLWRVDLGSNIRAGAHYTQFLVYDFDGDGKAEMVCKTAPGSLDGEGNYVTDAATDSTILATDNTVYYANSYGHILDGGEFLTVFNGETGRAVHTVWYCPNRAGNMSGVGTYPSSSSFWGDNYGNRSERYLACVAYLDGPDANPSAVMCRGYYTRAYLWAVDFDGSELKTKWVHGSVSSSSVQLTDADGNRTSRSYTTATGKSSGSKTAYANGNHNLSVADVDGDGCDEIIYSGAAIDNDGWLLYATGYGHGDAMHLSDLLPDREGLEVFTVHEDSPYGWNVHDAATGEILYSASGSSDNGRGLSADIDGNYRGFEFWSSNDRAPRATTNGESITPTGSCSVNFRVYWDGDLLDELYDDTKIDKWDTDNGGTTRLLTMYDYGNSADCNSTKHTPNLQADILGDWREEVILYDSSDGAALNIFTTTTSTDYRVTTLMQDHVYRMGVAWQNAAYNQPPHLGYYLPDAFGTRYAMISGSFEQTVAVGDSIEDITFHWVNSGSVALSKSIAPDGTETSRACMSGFSYSRDLLSNRTFTLKGAPSEVGDYLFVITSTNKVDNSTRTDTIVIHSADPTGISSVSTGEAVQWAKVASGAFSEQINLDVNVGATRNVAVGLYNAAGAQVFGQTYSASGSQRISISGLSHLPNGIYILRAVSAEGNYSTKVVKK